MATRGTWTHAGRGFALSPTEHLRPACPLAGAAARPGNRPPHPGRCLVRAEINAPPCVGAVHVPPPVPDPEELHWYPTSGLIMRVEEHTCSACRGVSYEYGLIGGAYRIRRTDRTDKRAGRQVHETSAVQRTVADEWWHAVLAGQAV